MSAFRRGDRARISWPDTPLDGRAVTVVGRRYSTEPGYNVLAEPPPGRPPLPLWIPNRHLKPIVPLADATREQS